MAIIDTATGAVTITTLTGAPTFAAKFTPDGAHAIQTATAYTSSYVDGVYTTTNDSEVAIIDTATGAVTRVDLPYGISSLDYQDGITLDATGTRVVLEAYGQYPEQTARVEFIDVATGDVTEFSLPGTGYNFQFNDGRTRLVVTAYDYPPGGGQVTASRIAVVDTATGLQVGSTLEVPGQYSGYYSNADRSQIITRTEAFVQSTGTVTHLTAIDVATGTQVGDTLTVRRAQSDQLHTGRHTGDHHDLVQRQQHHGGRHLVVHPSRHHDHNSQRRYLRHRIQR